MTRRRRRRRRRGYVLLVTLGLLVLSTTLLVAVGRAAARHAAEARLAQRRLQRTWALTGGRSAVAPYAEQLLVTAEQATGRPVPRLRADVSLGDVTVTVVVADEQAKADVNELLGRDPPDAVESRLTQAMSGTPAFAHVRLRPVADPPPARPIGGYGQLFDDVSPAVLLVPGPGGGPAATDAVTCWGDGGLNLMRATPAALRLSLSPSLSQLQLARLARARDAALAAPPTSHAAAAAPRQPDAVSALLAAAGVTPRDRARLPLVARSRCHSVLLIVNDGRRLWYDLAVTDESDPGRPRVATVAW